MRAFKALFKIESRLSLRGLDMFIFAIGMPIVVVIIIGAIFGNKPAYDGATHTFLEQSFGAISTIAICAGGVMGFPLVIADYRTRKILKRFKVTPISPTLILTVQLTIYALYAIVSLLLVYATASIFYGYQFQGSWIVFIGAYFLVMASMFSMGLLVGGLAPHMKIAGVIASLLYFPMLIFSGATLPYEVMPATLQKAADLLPLTQGIKMLKGASLGLGMSAESTIVPVIVMLALAVACVSLSLRYFKWE
ncbi:ABC transporter permease [Paenibacillus sp. J5C_2022]|uniref:ABC transporter permease n=1 Tax=Paenibacillus sp. J5C2022 TaxID=2977129 RepID=UPI0021CF10BD|nr:ABC transporter permease [Paenibacillus sp. J5C2022]MCU6707327.1 ABC transporter permease [Paenibacillus sp. J5C2022]